MTTLLTERERMIAAEARQEGASLMFNALAEAGPCDVPSAVEVNHTLAVAASNARQGFFGEALGYGVVGTATMVSHVEAA